MATARKIEAESKIVEVRGIELTLTPEEACTSLPRMSPPSRMEF